MNTGNTSAREVKILVAIFTAALALYAINWPFALSKGYGNLYGGTSTVGAVRILQGELPYRDFWTSFAPGQYYLLALLFRVFGTHLFVEVVAASAVSAMAACACFLLVLRLTGLRWIGAGAAAILTAAFFNTTYYIRLDGYPPAILSALIGYLILVRYFKASETRNLIWAGAAAGIAILFQDELGFYAASGACVGLAVHARGQHWRPLLVYVGSVAAVTLPVAAFFSLAAGHAFWDIYLVFPGRDWRLPGPKPELNPLVWKFAAPTTLDRIDNVLKYVKYTVPFLLNLVSLAAVVVAFRRRNFAVAAMGTTLWVAYWMHYSFAHIHINTNIITMSAYAAVNGAFLYSLFGGSRRAQAAAALLVVGWTAALISRPAYLILRKHRDPATATLTLPRVSGFRVTIDEAKPLNAVARYVAANVPAGQSLYVGLSRHDIMVMNDILAYFIFDRPIPVRYHELHPAMATNSAAHAEMIADITRHSARFVVTKTTLPDAVLDKVKTEYSLRLPDLGATDLDRFLRDRFRVVAEFAPYSVWASNDQAAGLLDHSGGQR